MLLIFYQNIIPTHFCKVSKIPLIILIFLDFVIIHDKKDTYFLLMSHKTPQNHEKISVLLPVDQNYSLFFFRCEHYFAYSATETH